MTATDEFEFDTEFIEPEPPEPSVITADVEGNQPDATIIDPKKRSRTAEAYEKKMRGLFRTGFHLTVSHPATRPDAAAIVMHAPEISKKIGDLADADPRIKKGIDFLTEGTENPYLAVIAASVPFALQLLRNHEPQLVPAQRGIKIPFTKRHIAFKFGIKLGRLRAATVPSEDLTSFVFGNAGVRDAMKKAGFSFEN